MSTNTDEPKIRLIAQGKDLWRVQVLFTHAEISRIPERLREIKAELAVGFGVPDELLEYIQLLSRKRTRSGILVEMQIRKVLIEAEAPNFRFLPETADDGTEFSDMLIEADLYPRDKFEQPLTREKIATALTQEGVDLACVDWGFVSQLIQQLADKPQPLLNQIIGRGKLPQSGQHSKITYAVGSSSASLLPSAWIGLQWVGDGDLLLDSSAATAGLRSGKNVFGRELQPRRGIQTRIEAGDGADLSPAGNQLRARRSGLLILTRSFQDRRIKDDSASVPAKLRADVISAQRLTESQVFKTGFEAPTVIMADVLDGSAITARSHLLICGNVGKGSQIQCGGSLRIIGNVDASSIVVHGHLAINGSAKDSQFHCDLTAQIDGVVTECMLYAREIIVDSIEGGIAEALIQNANNQKSSIQVNYRKFLENQQASGVAAVTDLREQLSLITELFGPEITQQVTADTVQLMLLRWLRRQKTFGMNSYSFRDVQEFRTILSLVPMIRDQLAATGAELREITAKLTEEKPIRENLNPET